MFQKINLGRKYQVRLPDKKHWKKGSPVRANSNCSTEGAKREYSVGSGIYGRKPRTTPSISSSKDMTFFQDDRSNLSLLLRSRKMDQAYFLRKPRNF